MAPKKPKSPKKADDADLADPGKMAEIKAEQIKKKKGKYGSVKIGNHRTQDETEQKKEQEEKTWVEFKILDAAGNPVKDPEKCKLTLSDKKEKTVSTKKGVIREENIDKGSTVTIQLKERYDYEWEFVRVEDSK